MSNQIEKSKTSNPSEKLKASKSAPVPPTTPVSPVSEISAIPPLKPYNHMRRGPFNFLRHKSSRAEIPKKPEFEKGGVTIIQPKERAAQAGAAGGSSNTDRLAKQLIDDPLIDFDLWKQEYNGQLELTDFKSMIEMIHQQERESRQPVESAGSISSDTPRIPYRPSQRLLTSDASSKKGKK